MSERDFYFNGINGTTGEYILPPMSPGELLKIIQAGDMGDWRDLQGLQWHNRFAQGGNIGPKPGIDPRDLSQTGWGVIFAYDADPAIKDALSELLQLRRAQAGSYYYEYSGKLGYRHDKNSGKFEENWDFIARLGGSPGPVDPENIPYYLLIVGDPETIPYHFQYQLNVQYAVGRIYFDSLEEYAQYAHSVVECESGNVSLSRTAAFWGVKNPDDVTTSLNLDHVLFPLAAKMADDLPDWEIQTFLEEQATKAQLYQLLGGDHPPELLFTSSHGMSFPNGDPRQMNHQGALLCQDWLGPQMWQNPIPEEFYFSADDIGKDAHLLGLLSFHLSSYSAGTPCFDDSVYKGFKSPPLSPHAFVGQLPQKLLGHPNGGALATVGYAGQAWGNSAMWIENFSGAQVAVFASVLRRLMDGHPIGSAMEYFSERYAELSSDLSSELEELKFGTTVNDVALSGLWIANNDARNYVIIGDPAVRLL